MNKVWTFTKAALVTGAGFAAGFAIYNWVLNPAKNAVSKWIAGAGSSTTPPVSGSTQGTGSGYGR